MPYSQVKITVEKPLTYRGREYMVYWDQRHHNHTESTEAGTFGITMLAEHLGLPVTNLRYVTRSFQSGKPNPPTAAFVFEVPKPPKPK